MDLNYTLGRSLCNGTVVFALLLKLAIRNKLTSILLPIQRRNHIVGQGNEFRECLYIPIWLLGRGILMHMALLSFLAGRRAERRGKPHCMTRCSLNTMVRNNTKKICNLNTVTSTWCNYLSWFIHPSFYTWYVTILCCQIRE